LLAYEESKGLGHSLAAEAHEDTDNPVDEILGDNTDDKGPEKPIKQDIGKNMMYHSFDFAQPDLVAPGHIVNLPAMCCGIFTDPSGGYERRDHINLTSANVDMAVGTGPEDDTPDDPTDDIYNRHKVLLWSQHVENLGDESYGLVNEDGTA